MFAPAASAPLLTSGCDEDGPNLTGQPRGGFVGNRLMTVLLTLDNELPSDLDRLVALRSECFAGRGFHPRLRLIHRIEFGYTETLRCSADNGSSFSRAWTGQETTAASRQGAGHPRYIRIKRSLVEDFAFCDEISLRLGLSVQPLHGRCTERSTGNGGQHHLVLCIHDTSPLCRLNQIVRSLAGSARDPATYDAGDTRDRKKGPVLESACSPTAR